MFTLQDLNDQVCVQGYVVLKVIKENGDVVEVNRGDISSVPEMYLNCEVAYIYPKDDELHIEVKDFETEDYEDEE